MNNGGQLARNSAATRRNNPWPAGLNTNGDANTRCPAPIAVAVRTVRSLPHRAVLLKYLCARIAQWFWRRCRGTVHSRSPVGSSPTLACMPLGSMTRPSSAS
jgi:hypothetical protein